MTHVEYTTEAGTALFAEKEDGTLRLIRWPRKPLPAIVPNTVDGKTVTEISPMAFANLHMEKATFEANFKSPYSFNMFVLKMGGHVSYEEEDQGGPTQIVLPGSITEIGAYAFWHCSNLKELEIPSGVRALPAGVFGECSKLERLVLSEGLEELGFFPAKTDMAMPDIGSMYCCHNLKELVLPETLRSIGAYCFNSAGIQHVCVRDANPGIGAGAEWSREITVAENAFDHAAALLWMDRLNPQEEAVYRVGLPAARDKILTADKRFGRLSHIPVDFFTRPVGEFDTLAKEAFRIDFSARMAIARIQYDGNLTDEARRWYVQLLVDYYGQAPQFMPAGEDPFTELLDILEKSGQMQAEDVSNIARTAGAMRLPSKLIGRILEIRTTQYESTTGFEDLDL